MNRAHPSSSPGKNSPVLDTFHYTKCFHQRKGKEEKHQQQQHQNAVIVATGFVHFVSHEMNECSLMEYQMLTYFDEFTISSSCLSLLVLSVLLTETSPQWGALYPACSRAKTHVELKTLQLEEMTTCEFTEYPIQTWLLLLMRDHVSLLLG
jgi:hypothetical protein